MTLEAETEIFGRALLGRLLAASAEPWHLKVREIRPRGLTAIKSSQERVRFQTELVAQLGCKLPEPLKLGLGHLVRGRAERLGLLRKALRVKDELAPTVLRFDALCFLVLVPLEVVVAVVDHQPLVLHQGKALHPSPLQRLGRAPALDFLLFGATLGRSLFGTDDPVDGKACLAHASKS